MADHLRQQILDAGTTLVTGLATTGTNVFQGRVAPFARDEVPALNVRLGPERIEVHGLGWPRIQERLLQLDVEIHLAASDGLDQALSQVVLEIERALGTEAAVTAAGLKALTLAFIERPQHAQNEKPVAKATMSYEARYATAENAPDVAL